MPNPIRLLTKLGEVLEKPVREITTGMYQWADGSISSAKRRAMELDAAAAAKPSAPEPTKVQGLLDMPVQEGYPADSASIVGYHYGKAGNLPELSGRMYGTGSPGREQERLRSSTDPRIRSRVYFYGGQEGGLIPRAEPVVYGGHVYQANPISGLFVPGMSDQSIIKASRPGGVFDPSTFESNVLDAGYSGYFTPNTNQAVVFKNRVPVEYLGTRQELANRIKK
jgi:hypothetical protein